MLMRTVSKFVVRQWPLSFLWPGSFSHCVRHYPVLIIRVYRIVLLIRLVICDRNATATTASNSAVYIIFKLFVRYVVCLFGLHTAFLWSLTVQPPKAYFAELGKHLAQNNLNFVQVCAVKSCFISGTETETQRSVNVLWFDWISANFHNLCCLRIRFHWKIGTIKYGPDQPSPANPTINHMPVWKFR